MSVSAPAPGELVLKFEGENFTHGTRAVSISEADEEEGYSIDFLTEINNVFSDPHGE